LKIILCENNYLKTHFKRHFFFAIFLFQQTDHSKKFTNLPKIGCNCHQSRFYFLQKSDPPLTIIKASEKMFLLVQIRRTKQKANAISLTRLRCAYFKVLTEITIQIQCAVNKYDKQSRCILMVSVSPWTLYIPVLLSYKNIILRH